MILSAITPKINVHNPNNNNNDLFQCPYKFILQSRHCCRGTAFTQRPTVLTNASPSLTNGTSKEKGCVQNPNSNGETTRYVAYSGLGEEGGLVASASAVAAAIRKASTSPVEFVQRIEKDGKNGLVLPSSDFQRLCVEQLDLFRRIIDSDAVLSVYVRPAGSYVMDRLELRRVIFYPGVNVAERADIVILIGNFGVSTGLRVAEAALSKQQVEVIPECRSVVFPMAKHPFVVGFLVAELPRMESETCRHPERDAQDVQLGRHPEESYAFPPCSERKLWEIQALKEDILKTYDQFTAEQRSIATNISRSLATAYVMDQKALLLQESSWQNNVRMSDLVEQIRSPLSSIRTLSKMLSVHMKRSEISYDIVEDILVQGDRMRDTLGQLQDAVYLTKANIVRYNEETLKKMHNSTDVYPKSARSQLSDDFASGCHADNSKRLGPALPLSSAAKDLEMPMPPLALAAVQHYNIRPCNVSDVLADLVGAAGPLAHKQQRTVELTELSQSLQVAVEESALRQALSNLIEGALLRTHAGGKIEIISTGAPAGGALVIIDDDGPDMHYMTQMHSLTPFGTNLSSEGMIEDNMTWNFVAGLTVAREILESYGSVVRVISPRTREATFGAGGTRIELWLPSLPTTSDPTDPAHEV
ncbi:Histidine kinase-like ATPase [Macleaya cordata]|uniref:Histidine kinase-like ATPase n=1 Tax=Macleaya cordata TaxID=56857 RepID=A0A200RCY8_MACCD|nr:Histidine kinase-like ATPase [Macleaya cordata]